MQKRALIIEKMPCHQEIIPSWVWALTRLGYEVDILANAPSHRHIGSAMKIMMKLTGFHFLTEGKANLEDYEVVLNNSLYPGDKIQHLRPGRRTLSVLHSLPAKPLDYKDFRSLRDPDHCILALGPHMQTHLNDQLHAFSSSLTPPIFFGDTPSIHKERHRFLVQGTMERFRRNYGCLAFLINKFADSNSSFEFTLMGDGGTGVESWLAPQIRPQHQKRLRSLLNTGYERFLTEIRKVGWVMPCVDDTYKHGYFTRKITSSVMMAIGNCTPLLLHKKLADIYGLKDGVNCLTYSNSQASLSKAFQTALGMPEEKYYRIVANARNVRQSWLQQLEQGVRTAVHCENLRARSRIVATT